MKISYVLPVWNAEHMINVTLRSLLKQTHKDFEIIVINDGSTDHTEEIINHYLKTDEGKIIYHRNHERQGAAVCRNWGNQISTGDIIAVCDCDSYMKSRGEILDKFFTDTDNDVFYSSVKCVSADDPSQEWIQEALKWDFQSKCPISHPTVAYKLEMVQSMAGYPQPNKFFKYHEKSKETDLFEFMLLDMHKAGAKFGGAQDVTCVKFEGDSERKTDEGKQIKKEMYKEYGIEL